MRGAKQSGGLGALDGSCGVVAIGIAIIALSACTSRCNVALEMTRCAGYWYYVLHCVSPVINSEKQPVSTVHTRPRAGNDFFGASEEIVVGPLKYRRQVVVVLGQRFG